MRSAIILALVFAFLSVPLPAHAAKGKPITDEAERIYHAYGDAIYQVQTIDLASDKKSSIGSGFQFTKDGLIATNYHVVAEAVQRPANNRLEYLHDKGEKGNLKILIADVVHDLAILKMDRPGRTQVNLGTSDIPKGAKLFSLGNPHDIGFSIIEGTNNGKNEESFFDKIHFSGSINPGMSGGPVLGHDGRVVGVNVQTGGNSIGFLVPVEPLRALYATYEKEGPEFDFLSHADEYIGRQLLNGQKEIVGKILNAKWESVAFGPFMVPGRITDAFKCWGDSDIQEKNPYTEHHLTCSSQDRQFLDEDPSAQEAFYTGTYIYAYDSVVGKEEMNMERFYSYYESQYGQPIRAYGNAGESNVTNFDCDSHFVDLADKRWKSSFCVRQYKKYPQLYDMHLYMALVGADKQGMMITAIAEGVSKESALKVARRFMEGIVPRAENNAAAMPVAVKAPEATPAAETAPKHGEARP